MMHICAAWLSKHAPLPTHLGTPELFMSGLRSLTPSLRLLGHGYLAQNRFSTLPTTIATVLWRLGPMRRSVPWRTLRDWSPILQRPCLPWVIINTGCYEITRPLKQRSAVSSNFCLAVVRPPMLSAELRDSRATLIKAFATWNKLSRWTRVTES